MSFRDLEDLLAPAEHIALYEACIVEKNFDKARRIMGAMMPLMNLLDEGKFVQKIKHGSKLLGLKPGATRRPLLQLTAEEEDRVARTVAALKREVAEVAGEASR